MMKVQVITLFPAMFKELTSGGMLLKASNLGIAEYEMIDLRQFGLGPRKQVDDTPYGGGDGMLLMIEPLTSAIKFAKQNSPDAVVVLPTPRGKLYKQSDAKVLAKKAQDLIIICPRYEGYDERVTGWVDKSYCIGNYILTGGEIPAMIIIDSVVRLLPGVLGGESSAEIESFQKDDRSVEYPQYTRPEQFEGLSVPSVLLSGNHAVIESWRNENSIRPPGQNL